MISWIQFVPGMLVLFVAVLVVLIRDFKREKPMSAASDRLAASVANVKAAVEKLLATPIPTDDSAAENAAADALDSLAAEITAKINPPALAGQ